MTGALRMTREEMEQGLAVGRVLIQEEWAHPQEIAWADELVSEGKATASDWQYHPNYQCERRRITGRPAQEADSNG